MNTKRRTFGMGTLATLLLAGTAAAGDFVHLEFKHERLADGPAILGLPSQMRFREATIAKGGIVDLEQRDEGARREQAVRTARVQRREGVAAGSLEQICSKGARSEWVTRILGLQGACD